MSGQTERTQPWRVTILTSCWPVAGSQIRTEPTLLLPASSSRPATMTGHMDKIVSRSARKMWPYNSVIFARAVIPVTSSAWTAGEAGRCHGGGSDAVIARPDL